MSKCIPRWLKTVHQLTMIIINLTKNDSGSKSQHYAVKWNIMIKSGQ